MGEDEDEGEEDEEDEEEGEEVEEVEDDDASAASAASALGRGVAAAAVVSSEPSPSGGGGGGRSRTRRRRRARAVPAPFPQEVLQAVVRGAVDQSVECALGAGALRADDDDGGGPGATRGFFSPTPPDADAFPRRSRDRVAPPFERVAEHEHPLRGAASGGFDEERADSEEDAAVAEDAAGLYGMVRDALRASG